MVHEGPNLSRITCALCPLPLHPTCSFFVCLFCLPNWIFFEGFRLEYKRSSPQRLNIWRRQPKFWFDHNFLIVPFHMLEAPQSCDFKPFQHFLYLPYLFCTSFFSTNLLFLFLKKEKRLYEIMISWYPYLLLTGRWQIRSLFLIFRFLLLTKFKSN